MTPSNDEAGLGGRLPLLRRADLSGAQQTLWDRTEASMGRWADEVGFRSKSADGRFIGPFNPTLRSPEIALSLLQFQIDEAKHTSLSERVRQVIILSVGSVWKAPYELYAHAAAAKLKISSFSGLLIAREVTRRDPGWFQINPPAEKAGALPPLCSIFRPGFRRDLLMRHAGLALALVASAQLTVLSSPAFAQDDNSKAAAQV